MESMESDHPPIAENEEYQTAQEAPIVELNTLSVAETNIVNADDGKAKKQVWLLPRDPHHWDHPDRVDIIHVTALRPKYALQDLDEQYMSQYMFECDMAYFLAGDLISGLIELLAVRLLTSIVDLRAERIGTTNEHRAIIFIAYDFGSLVVKRAIALAAQSEETYPRIFTNTSRLIFSGCPHRSIDSSTMEQMLFSILRIKENKAWSALVNANSVRNLAQSLVETNEMFLASKMILRTRVISIHSNEQDLSKNETVSITVESKERETSATTIDSALDSYTATLGVPSEIVLEEANEDKSEIQSPLLLGHVSDNDEHWIPHAHWVLLERLLLSQSSAKQRLGRTTTTMDSLGDQVTNNSAFKTWGNATSSQLLYLDGISYNRIHEAADQIFVTYRQSNQEVHTQKVKTLFFAFDADEPLQKNLQDMLTSLYLQILAGRALGSLDGVANAIHEWLQIGGGWNNQSSLNLFGFLLRQYTPGSTTLLIHNFDACPLSDRTNFLDYYRDLADRSELRLKVLVTSRTCGVLLPDLKEWLSVNIDDADGDSGSARIIAIIEEATRFCASVECRDRVRDKLATLASAQPSEFPLVVQLLRYHTEWPEKPSSTSLTHFEQSLDLVDTHFTAARVLEDLLRSNRDLEELKSILSWILGGARPLSQLELVRLHLSFHERKSADSACRGGLLYTLEDVRGTTERLQRWLRVLATFEHNRLVLRDEFRDILSRTSVEREYIWNEVIDTAPSKLLRFCFQYLEQPDTLDCLQSLFKLYEEELQSNVSNHMQPPLAGNNDDLVFFVVASFPDHLAKCLKYGSAEIKSEANRYANSVSDWWAKVYWAATNPISRRIRPPANAHELLTDLGVIANDANHQENASPDANPEEFEVSGKKEKWSLQEWQYALADAILTQREDRALQAARKIISLAPADSASWPQSAIWAATWSNMDSLLSVMLRHGAPADPQTQAAEISTISMRYFPSPLYMASVLGHASVVRLLLSNRGSLEVLKQHTSKAVHAAALEGHTSVIQEFYKNNPKNLHLNQPENLLFAASSNGCPQAVAYLLREHMHPETSIGTSDDDHCKWTPLAIACKKGFHRTVRTLLQGGADPNSLGPWDIDTPLWFAIKKGHSLDCVRHLIEHGGDPNHEHLNPPILSELAGSDLEQEFIISVCDVLKSGNVAVDIRTKNWRGATALGEAVRFADRALATWLLKFGANVNAVDNFSRSILYYAAEKRDLNMVQDLLAWEPQLDITDDVGTTILEVASSEPAIVEVLLNAGANPDFQNGKGETLINIAVRDDQPDVVKLLVTMGANIHHPCPDGSSPIYKAVQLGQNPAIFRLLVEAGAKLDETDEDEHTLLHQGINGPVETFKHLLEFGKRIDLNRLDKKNQTPLLAASMTSDMEYVKLLIRAGADINCADSFDETAVHNAVWLTKFDLLSVLLAEPDVEVNRMGKNCGSPLHVACYTGQVGMISQLLDAGADVNLVDSNIMSSTPLMAALLYRKWPENDGGEGDRRIEQMVRTLVRNGADVNLRTRCGAFYNALEVASFRANASTINFLLDERASYESTDPYKGWMPIHLAAASGLENFQTVLQSYKGDILVPDKFKKNALHWAAQQGNAKTVEFILSNPNTKAAVNVADDDGWTALCWAMRPSENIFNTAAKCEKSDYYETVRCLLNHEADPQRRLRYGSGDEVELRILARAFSVEPSIVEMIEEAIRKRCGTDGSEPPERMNDRVRQYVKPKGVTCDNCFSDIYGLEHSCDSCYDFQVCSKCIDTVKKYHNKATKDDGKPHAFTIGDSSKEFQDPVPSSDELDQAQEAGEVNTELATPERLARFVDDSNLWELSDDDEMEITGWANA